MEEILTIVGSGLLAFLVGSFPTAYILVRRKSGKDLRKEGSGNIGTLNAFEVTRSRVIGAGVLLIDLVKGAIPVFLVYSLLGDVFLPASAALIGTVLGHNYSPWIGWKGGRGLAPAAGATLVYNPLLLVIWVIFWLAAFAKTRNVHFGNISATLLSPLIVLLFPELLQSMSLFTPASPSFLPAVAVMLFALIFLKHIDPFRQLIERYRKSPTRS
ncbi:MAG: glycerol-3-phosphate acyltransferase [Bacteroidetes bacterium]|nr:glycerol-3-phosphate acyltransferase [Bacteroidota bacterium]